MMDFEQWTDIEDVVREAERLPRLACDLRHRVLSCAQRRHERGQARWRLAIAASLLFCVGQVTLWMQPAAESVAPQFNGQLSTPADDVGEWGTVDSVVRVRIEQSRTMLSLF